MSDEREREIAHAEAARRAAVSIVGGAPVTRRQAEPTAWSDRFNWPPAGEDHVFLGHAIEKLGNAKFGADWIASREQRQAAAAALVSACADGKIGTYTREGHGDIAAALWLRNGTAIVERCAVNDEWVFIGGGELGTLMERLALPPVKSTAAAEKRASDQLLALAKASLESGEPAPTGALWKAQAMDEFGISERATNRVWSAVAKNYPALSSLKKPKRRR
ncbi:hypothetical protein ACO2Q3_22670 [Caulobacter sp. KR2-114]|uniref:hypothetical protein n=1 Tax=Caulobacter sp. KR2-114 TaxID=3400912 RepID=UPI003BFC1014